MNWGKLALINLYDCDKNLIKNKREIKKFIKELTKKINMKGINSAKIKRFGKESLKGYSAFQFIETSSITCHFDETENRAFIDIFSCKDFETDKIKNFCKEFFQAEKAKSEIIIRK